MVAFFPVLFAVQYHLSFSLLQILAIATSLGATLVILIVAYTRTRTLAADLKQANRAKLEFLATMSHELRTPLNAIAGYTDLLALGLRGPVTDEQKEDLARIQHNQRQLLALINDVLNFAKLDTGGVLYSISTVRIPSVLESAYQFVEPQIAQKQIAYTNDHVCESDDDFLLVRADEEKLYQIFVNLLSNAVKFTPSGGRIQVTCSKKGSNTQIVIADTGIGIPRHKLEEIFDPFVQVDTSLTREHSGVGLGLSISRHLALGMQGDLTVESQVGEGATFTVTLPSALDPSFNPSSEVASRDTYTMPDHSTLRVRV